MMPNIRSGSMSISGQPSDHVPMLVPDRKNNSYGYKPAVSYEMTTLRNASSPKREGYGDPASNARSSSMKSDPASISVYDDVARKTYDEEYKYKKLFEAIASRDLGEIKQLLNQGLDIYFKMHDGNTPYGAATQTGDLDLLKYLQKYAFEQRNCPPKQMEQKYPIYQDMSYHSQSRVHHPLHSRDHTLASLSLLPSSNIMSQPPMVSSRLLYTQYAQAQPQTLETRSYMNSYTRSISDRSFGQYPFDHAREMNQHDNLYGVDRMSKNYGHSNQQRVALPQGAADSNMSKFASNVHHGQYQEANRNIRYGDLYTSSHSAYKQDRGTRDACPASSSSLRRKGTNSPLVLDGYQTSVHSSLGNSHVNSFPSGFYKNHLQNTTKTPDLAKPPSQNSVKNQETTVIDLTKCNSPEVQNNNLPLYSRESSTNSFVIPPLIYSSNNDTDERFRNVQPSFDQWQREHMSGYRKSPYSNSSNNLPNSLPQYVSTPEFHRSLLPFHPSYAYPPNYTMPMHNAVDPTASYSMYEQKRWEDSFNDLVSRTGSVSNSPLGKLGNPGFAPQRYLTSSPHLYTSLEHSRKKNDSPSLAIGVKSKTLPQPTSDLTFNYPESNKTEYSTLSKYTTIDNGMLKKDLLYPPANNKLLSWMSNDDSKLSPFENELLDSAARDKSFNKRCAKVKPAVHDHTADFTPTRAVVKTEGQCKKQESFRNSIGERRRKPDDANPNCECVASRNSVIKTVPNFNANSAHSDLPRNEPTVPLTPAGVAELSRGVPPAVDGTEQAKKNTDADVTLDFNGASQGNDDECVFVEDSDVKLCDLSGDNKTVNIDDCVHEEKSVKSPKKRKLSVTKDPNSKSKKKCIAAAETTCQENASNDDIYNEANSQNTEKRRPRRSGDMDEYLYGWDPFSDEETENDDSSDEDYSCPQSVPKTRVFRATAKVRTTRRTASMKSVTKELSDNDFVLEDEIDLKTTKKSTPIKAKTKRIRRSSEKTKEKGKRKRIKSRLYVKDDDSDDSELDKSQSIASPDVKPNPSFQVKPEPCIDKKEYGAKHTKDIATDEPAQTKDNAKSESEKPKTVEAAKKKRKYSKSKDEVPSKKSKKIKTIARQSVPKIKKYKKLLSKSTSKNKNELLPSVNCKIPSAISPSLVELYTGKDGKHKAGVESVPLPRASADFKDQEFAADEVSNQPVSKEKPDSKQSTFNNTTQPKAQQISSSPETKTKKRLEKSELRVVSSFPKKANSETTLPAKVKKKPGRKPGPKKLASAPANSSPKKDEKLKNRKNKKVKKSKGDGLPRFGMRKKNRGNKMKSNKLSSFKPKEKLNNVKPSSPGKQDPVNRSLDFSADDHKPVKMDVKWKGNERCMLESASEINALDTNSIVSSKATDLKSDAQLLDLDDYEHSNSSACGTATSSVKDDEHPCTSLSFNSFIKKEYVNDFESEFSQSQSSEKSLGNHIPLPLNFKKLWCNSAIGETQLHKAARYGYNDNLLYYLQRGFNVKQCDNAGYTALHEACVHNHLESAFLLLQYGADVNKNANDGTRPLHDAVEYDHIEMTRLMLATGADPMLSKFSGRSVSNMIYSTRMGKFIKIYLKELTEEFCDDEELKWDLPCSQIFDNLRKPYEYDVLGDPPAEDGDNQFEFELFEQKPAPTYLLQPHDESKRQNFYLLDDYLDGTAKRKSARNLSVRVHATSREKFQSQARDQFLSRKNIPSGSSSFVELVAVSKQLTEAMGAEIVRVKVIDEVPVVVGAPDCTKTTKMTETSEGTDVDKAVSSTLDVDHKDFQSKTSNEHDKDILLSEEAVPVSSSSTKNSAHTTSTSKSHQATEQTKSQCNAAEKNTSNNKHCEGCSKIPNSVCCSDPRSESPLYDLTREADLKLAEITSNPLNENSRSKGEDCFSTLCHSSCNNEITKAKMDDGLELRTEQPLASVS